MVLRSIPSFEEKDLDEFFSLFDMSKLDGILLKVYNGTPSSYVELPNGGHVLQRKYEVFVKSVKDMRDALEVIDHNQVESCDLSFKVNGTSPTILFKMLERELHIDDVPGFFDMNKILAFCRKNDIYKLVMSGF